MAEILGCLSLAIVFVLGIFALGVKVVPEYQRFVVFRLGRLLDKPTGPGLVFLIPGIDRAVKVDLREQKRELFNQQATTKDFIPASCDFRWNYKILDPVKSVVNVGNIETAMTGFIIEELRNEIQEINSAALPSELTRLSSEFLRNNRQLREASEKLGITVTYFEILKLAVDAHKVELNAAQSTIGTFGETQTTVHTSGTVIVGEKTWEAMSNLPIAPNTKIRVKRVILEVEESR